MQKSHSWPNRSPLELFVFKCNTLIDIIYWDSQLPFGHIEEDAKHSFFLELFVAERLSIGSITMSQLSITVEGPAKCIVAECRLQIEISIFHHTDFKLIFCSGICNDFPVMNAFIEAFVGYDCAEEVLFFFEE